MVYNESFYSFTHSKPSQKNVIIKILSLFKSSTMQLNNPFKLTSTLRMHTVLFLAQILATLMLQPFMICVDVF